MTVSLTCKVVKKVRLFNSLRPFLFVVIYLTASQLFAQSNITSITCGNYRKIYSNILHEERVMLISLPDDYTKSEKKCPVLFKLDGDKGNFMQASAAAGYLLDMTDYAQDLIIIGIENTDRNRDMLPDQKADAFLQFISTELIPFVDKNYRTNGFRILSGQSLSSLFAVYSFLKQPGLFNAYILGSFGLFKESFAVLFQNELTKNNDIKLSGKKYFFIGNGKMDANDPDGTITKRGDLFLESLRQTIPPFIMIKYKMYDEEGHVPFPTVYDGLKWIFSQERNGIK